MIKYLLTVVFILFQSLYIFSQEYTAGTAVNGEIKKYIENKPEIKTSLKSSKGIIELPFWDDFSYKSVYADPYLWEVYDKVYVNSVLAEEPPSIGYATFDAADAAGEIYSHADYDEPFIADFLTSDSINLNYPGDNTVFLSFYYKPQGIGNDPELEDSLILEFYAPEEDNWTIVWFAEGSENADFQLVMINVNEEKYLKRGFKFRFKNYASLGSETYPSFASNCDYWHVDYVYLNRNRNINDTVFHDIAFNKPLHSLINGFESVPWKHYKLSSEDIINYNIHVEYKNNDNVTRNIDSLNYTLTDESGLSADQILLSGNKFPPPFKQEFLNEPHIFTFPVNSDDFAEFTFKARIVTSTFDSISNNSVSYQQRFSDYYAYDDGSAEAGYGIYGTGTKYGSVAYKFTPLTSDVLTGVRMYFTRTLNDVSQKYFWIYIWEVGPDGLPGDTIRTFEGIKPEYEDELNKFHLYKFDTGIQINGPFFIGWTQTTEDKLNIGFDYNNIANDKLFYRISESWIQSNEIGAAMIRPVFGDFFGPVYIPEKKNLKLYPNPANDFLHIDLKQFNNNSCNIYIFDIQGRLLISKHDVSSGTIYIKELPRGIYILRLTDEKGSYESKFIKQ